MIWVAWRQFRAQALTALAVLAAATAYFVTTGLSMHRTYATDLSACGHNDCSDTLNQLLHGYSDQFNLAELLVIVAPGVIGIFWGAPLIGRELETGTHQLAWNQSVMRTRWLAVKTAGVGAASIATAGLLSYLVTWWAGPLDQIDGDRLASQAFASHDIVPLAYAAFAFALGTTAGLLLRRTVPAMALTVAVFAGVQILVPAAVRPNLLPSTTVTFPVDPATASQVAGIYTSGGGAAVYLSGLPVPQGAWVQLTTPMEDSSGQVVAASTHLNCFPDFQGGGPAKGARPDVERISACLAAYDLHESVTYQPASHYWRLQWYESGIFAALAAALLGFCFWWIRRRQN